MKTKEPDCDCVQTDVDQADSSSCQLHNGRSPYNKAARVALGSINRSAWDGPHTPEQSIAGPGWHPIVCEIRRKVLVTNNLLAQDAFGRKSHVWCVDYVHEDSKNGYNGERGRFYTIAIDRGEAAVCNLSHFHEVPQWQA